MDKVFELLQPRNPKVGFIRKDDAVKLRDRVDYNPFPPAYYFVYFIGAKAQKYFGGQLAYAIEMSKGSYFTGKSRGVFGPKKEFENLQEKIIKKVISNSDFICSLYKKSEIFQDKIYKLSEELLGLDYVRLPDEKIIAYHKQWIQFYADFSFWNIAVWFILGDRLADYVNNLLMKSYSIGSAEIELLTTPDRPSYIFREECDLLRIASKVNFTKKSLSAQSEGVKELLSKHASRWNWIPFDYIGPSVWTSNNFLTRLFSLVKNKNQAEFVLKKKINYHTVIRKEQRTLIKKLGIAKKHLRLIQDLQTTALMQDKKKEICTFAQYALHKAIFKRFASRFNIRTVDCIKFHHEELWHGLQDNGVAIRKMLPERLQAMTVVGVKDGMYIIGGRKAVEIFEKFDEKIEDIKKFKGNSASLGVVRGVARVLISTQELKKMNKGDILITTMTTPDFVMAMKKAAAIVTDEGGMTSHAAIISRELGIPCIVGTKVATQVLRDGDMIEVDANKGVVKIL